MSDVFQLEPNEIVELKFRRHWILFVGSSIWTALSAFLPFIIYPLVIKTGLVTSDIDPRLLSFAAALWLLIVWSALAVLWTDYYLDIWYVTDKRIINIDQVGLFNRIVSSWGIERVVEVTVHTENFLQTLLGYGTLQIQTAGPTDEYARAEGVPHPERVRAAILMRAGKLDALEHQARVQNDLLHAVSHEAKGYLSKDAAALAAIAAGDVGDVPLGVQNLASRALQETRNGVSTMMSILRNGISEEQSRKPFDASKAARDAVESFTATASMKGLSINSSLEDSVIVAGDEMQIRELVFKALIDNAIRYTLIGSITVSLTRDGKAVLYSVQDTGIGMTDDDIAKLFSDGGHGEHSKELNSESTGYGLSTARKVVTAYGGEIRGESEGPGRGSKFVVRLPIT